MRGSARGRAVARCAKERGGRGRLGEGGAKSRRYSARAYSARTAKQHQSASSSLEQFGLSRGPSKHRPTGPSATETALQL